MLNQYQQNNRLSPQIIEHEKKPMTYDIGKLGPGLHVDASYQVSVHMAKQFQRRRFLRNPPIRKKNCMWLPCLQTDWDEMSNLHRGH
jgi:hypothetical protein